MTKLKKPSNHPIIEFIKDFVIAVIIVIVINSFIVFHARVPSGSMIPTIQIGDHLIVNRIPYYFSDPDRGDIVVFNFYDDRNGEKTKYIKRAIGLPGDTVDIVDGYVYVNGELLDETAYLPEGTVTYESNLVDFPITIPDGEYLMMGDNRGNSHDGRFFGTISRKDIVGKGNIRFFPLNKISIIK